MTGTLTLRQSAAMSQTVCAPFALLPRHHRDLLEARLHLVRQRREIRLRVLAAIGICDDEPVGAGNDVALAQGRIVLDRDRCEARLVFAVAGAARDYFGAITE